MRQELSMPFETRAHRGLISIRVIPNDDPWASGHQLVVPDLNAEAFRGFPICTASLRYHGHGLNAVMGWIQVVTREYDGAVFVDLPPNLDHTDPFTIYGHLPTFFAAPANPEDPDGTWQSDTFLVVVPDVLRSRTVTPLTAFTWGYRLRGGHPSVLDITPTPTTAWSAHLPVLTKSHPAWTFT